jgi:hypothetical protein
METPPSPLSSLPEESWTCGPPKVMKNASVQQPLSMEPSLFPLSSRPKRTRISCHAALDMTTRAAFFKESRMKFANATKLNRKSGVAQRRDLCVDAPSWKCFSTERSAAEGCAVFSSSQEIQGTGRVPHVRASVRGPKKTGRSLSTASSVLRHAHRTTNPCDHHSQ